MNADVSGYIDIALSNWPLIHPFAPVVGLAIAAGGGVWLAVSIGLWIIDVIRQMGTRKELECMKLLSELIAQLDRMSMGVPAVDYLRQVALVAELKSLGLLPPFVTSGDRGLKDICARVLEITQTYDLRHARKFVQESLGEDFEVRSACDDALAQERPPMAQSPP